MATVGVKGLTTTTNDRRHDIVGRQSQQSRCWHWTETRIHQRLSSAVRSRSVHAAREITSPSAVTSIGTSGRWLWWHTLTSSRRIVSRTVELKRCHRVLHGMVDQVLTLLDSQPKPHCNNNNNNNNDNILGAVIIAQSHCKSSAGSCDEYGTAPRGRRPSDQTKRPRLRVRLYRQSEATPTITIYYYYLAQKLILIWPSHGG